MGGIQMGAGQCACIHLLPSVRVQMMRHPARGHYFSASAAAAPVARDGEYKTRTRVEAFYQFDVSERLSAPATGPK